MKQDLAVMLPELNANQLKQLDRHIELEKLKAVADFIHKVKAMEPSVPTVRGTEIIRHYQELPK